MSYVISIGDTPTVPTKRYRFLAIIFCVLALAGLFLGFLGAWIPLFAHSSAVLNSNVEFGLSGAEGGTLSGMLLGYIIQMFSYYFGTAGAFSGENLTGTILKILGFAQVAFLALAIVLAFILAIVACLVRGRKTRNCAMFSAYLVTTAYLWLFLSVMFRGAGSDPSLPLLGLTVSIDMPTLIVVAACLVILAIVTICRRTFTRINKSFVGVVTVLVALFFGVGLFGFIYQETYTYGFTVLLVGGALEGFTKYLFIVLVSLFAFNILLAIWRQNAKRFYPFDAVRYGLLFLAVLTMFVYFIIKPAAVVAENSDRFLLFKDKNLILSLMLIFGTLLAFLFSILNAHLVEKRRRRNLGEAEETENQIDEIDKNEETVYTDGTYEVVQTPVEGQLMPNINVTVQAPPAPSVTVNIPAPAMPAPVTAETPAAAPNPIIVNNTTPATAPTTIQVPAQSMPMPMPMPMPIPMPMPMPMYAPQAPVTPPAPQSVPVPMPGYQPPMPLYQNRSGMNGVMGGHTPPVIVVQPNAPTASTPTAEPASAPVDSDDYGNDFLERINALASSQPADVEEEEAAHVVEEEMPAEAEETLEAVYYGPYDEFFTPLSEQLKAEFNELFIVKSRGEFGLPAYKVGGNNKAFFAKVFTRLGKFRPMISDELIGKIYDYTSK